MEKTNWEGQYGRAKGAFRFRAALDFFMGISYRHFVAKGRERLPSTGDFGLVNQLGSAAYARPRKFREA